MYLHPKFERKKGVLPWLWITHWPLTFHIVQGLNKLWKIVIQEIYMACQHEDEPPMHSGKLANSSCWSGKEWRTKSPLHDGKKIWPKKNSMDRSVRPEIASRTNQGGCWICMQMPNFCYGICIARWLTLQNHGSAKRKEEGEKGHCSCRASAMASWLPGIPSVPATRPRWRANERHNRRRRGEAGVALLPCTGAHAIGPPSRMTGGGAHTSNCNRRSAWP